MIHKDKGERSQISGLVTAIVTPEDGGPARIYHTHNIVSDAGDVYYAESGAAETVTNAFDTMELGTNASSAPAKGNDTDDLTLIASTAKVVKATYPQTADGDADNTGATADTVTWTFEWTAADFNSTVIADGMIVLPGHGAASPILTHFEFAAVFTKAATDTLKVIVNHLFTGV